MFFDSLNKQSFDLNLIEVILVDQNEDDENLNIVKKYERVSSITKYIKSKKGLSLSRNEGLKHVTGSIVAFPDDDCVYEDNILHCINNYFSKNDDISFVSTNSHDLVDYDASLVSFPKFDCGINARHLIGCSFTLFFKREFIDSAEKFDEKMGVGSKYIYGAGEEHDFMLRGMSKGHCGVFLKDLFILHPVKGELFNSASFKRRFSYSSGLAYFLLKNKKLLGRKVFLSYLANQVAMVFHSLKPTKFVLNVISLIGLFRGLLHVWWYGCE